MTGFFQVGDELHSVWGPEQSSRDVGATVGHGGVTSIVVDKADGPMGHYAVAVVYRGFSVWQVLPLHMMSEVVVEPGEN